MLAAQPENHRRNAHQNSRNTERPTVAVLVPDLRNDDEREEGAEVNRPVKSAVGFLKQVALVRLELIAHERRDARLDSSRSERDQRQTDAEQVELRLGCMEQITHRQHAVARAVEARDPEDGVVAPEKLVGDPRPQQRREVVREDEQVKDARGLVVGHVQPAPEELGRHVAHEDAFHPVEAEAFARFVADNVFDLGGPAIVAGRGWIAHAFGKNVPVE